MTKRNNLIIPSIIVSITLLIIFGIFLFIYYNLELRKQTLQSNQNSKHIEESDNKDKDKNKNKNENQNISENTEIILLNYKIDSKNTLDTSKIPHEAVLNNPDEACQSIIETKNTRNHTFYMFEDSQRSLEEKYDQYRKLVPYIDNNLISQNKILQIIKDLCIASGYNIN